jgi:hypothetical protein
LALYLISNINNGLVSAVQPVPLQIQVVRSLVDKSEPRFKISNLHKHLKYREEAEFKATEKAYDWIFLGSLKFTKII